MSDPQTIPSTVTHEAHLEPHPPFLAHHYATPEQQYQSNKLGMWVFLSTEILMFGGLFCAYAVYRHNHPDVFAYAHRYLDRTLGGINTIILITSSLTMAWAVRCAQINKQRGLIICLALTILGGLGFMGIKSVEYHQKWKHHLWVGASNKYSLEYKGPKVEEHTAHAPTAPVAQRLPRPNANGVDPNAGTADEPKIKPSFVAPAGLAPNETAAEHDIRFADLSRLEQERVNAFFSVYFLMTGLHGLHVLIGMGLISWVLSRAIKREFTSQYFTPVDLVGLYWHLVDLIWIFLFPLLYLIH
ncbi:MAG: cytochrome c oxidase subunit 3 [Bacillota bacterium]